MGAKLEKIFIRHRFTHFFVIQKALNIVQGHFHASSIVQDVFRILVVNGKSLYEQVARILLVVELKFEAKLWHNSVHLFRCSALVVRQDDGPC